MRKTLLVCGLALLLPAADTNRRLPAPYHTPSATNGPRVVPAPAGSKVSLPPGFVATEFASGDFRRPRFMLAGPSGEILITDAIQDGSVIVLFDRDKDGKAEERKTLVEGLDRPYGMAWNKNWLYVAEPTSVKRYAYDAKNFSVGKGEEIISYPGMGQGHWTRSLLFDAKAKKLYVGVGSRSNVDAGEPEQRAAIMRYNEDGSQPEIFAAGTRNPIGLTFFPGSTTLWAAVQERDGLGDDLVPDYFTSIRQGGFYGWPYAYIGPNEDPRRKGEKPELVAKTIEPDVPLQAHSAILDVLFYTGKSFPKKYQGGAFLALHGSWNRAKRTGYSVVYVPFRNGKPAGAPEDFLTGFMISPDSKEVWGRPVAFLQLPDGSVLVSDDGGNKIWRITWKG
jgi:glucose/arabinose dehydrogenase